MSRLRIMREQRTKRRRVSTGTLAITVGVLFALGFLMLAVRVLGGNALGQTESVTETDVGSVDKAGGSQVASIGDAITDETVTVAVASTVEVPPVSRMRVADAQMVLKAAGLVGVVIGSSEGTHSSSLMIESQEPAAGNLVPTGSRIQLITAPSLDHQSSPADRGRRTSWTVCIDPGHQSRGDSSPEPIGPGAKETKPRMTGGATGVATRIPEYEVVLQISMNLKERLEAQGVRVVMTRTTNDVNLSNKERAAIANRARADLFVRIHCDGSPEEDMAGISTVYPTSNKWTAPFARSSKRAAAVVQRAVIDSTGAIDRGTRPRSDLTGFNWARVPSILVECGFLSNPVEDRLLASPHYQDKLAQGIADGIVRYLEGQR